MAYSYSYSAVQERQDAGEALQQNQLDKINDRENIQAEVDSLTAKMEAL